MTPRKSRAQKEREEHENALADLQDAVDRTREGSERAGEPGWEANLQRAKEREAAAHAAVERRKRRGGDGAR